MDLLLKKQDLFFFNPVFQERIWGGTQLKDIFGYDIPNDKTGECWAISAHENGPSIVVNGEFSGLSLSELWNQQRHLFGNLHCEKFPLLTKILDAKEDLSVQVHPNDTYAQINENGELGKTECWYVLDCEENAELILGHNAQSKAEFLSAIKENRWDEVLRRIKIKPGDFFYIPSGTVHAICKGTLILETQQNSDTTYRLYDYDRRDDNDNLRELHIEKSMDVITFPHVDANSLENEFEQEGTLITEFVNNEFFSVERWEVTETTTLSNNNPFILVSVVEGEGSITINEDTCSLKKGDHFLIPCYVKEFTVDGQMVLITSHV
ncbi:mannose-6-phosphate isomerase, class I [Gottfriedia acidiceleris]|uniref:mannose-6-phosphate isomerase, class I n=1 Tax=Gottfriedia acidiceleris TaxID=371036 RepID=UPI000B4351C6|nr:mannose-6-phosphate isomerase, class I [Gottfriedia acidiceleris]